MKRQDKHDLKTETTTQPMHFKEGQPTRQDKQFKSLAFKRPIKKNEYDKITCLSRNTAQQYNNRK